MPTSPFSPTAHEIVDAALAGGAALLASQREARADRARRAGLPHLADLAPGAPLQYTAEGRTRRAEYLGVDALVLSRRAVGWVLRVRNLGGEEVALPVADLAQVAPATPVADECAGLELDSATSGRKAERCVCGLSRRLHGGAR